MAPPPNPKQSRNRRRKKRRTEDFSSDSDSSDSDSSSAAPTTTEEPTTTEPAPQIDMEDIDIESDSEMLGADASEGALSAETQQQLNSIKFTNTTNQPIAEAKDTVRKDRQQLENEFLAHMATGFANDLDELRKKPDFNEKSIVMLAKTLQSGHNMFDDETLNALLE